MKTVRWTLRIMGFLSIAFGLVVTGWALWEWLRLWMETHPAIERLEAGEYARVAFAALVGGMFFLVAGSGIVLISFMKMQTVHAEHEERPRWWLKVLALFVSAVGIGAMLLATVFAGMSGYFEDFTGGIVSYFMMAGVGLLIAAWGLKRAGDSPAAENDRLT